MSPAGGSTGSPRAAPVAVRAVVGGHEIGDGRPLLLIAGPCVLESEAQAVSHARGVGEIAAKHGVHAVFKASFDKANRTSAKSFRGVGLEAGLAIFEKVKRETGLPCLTDVHEAWQAEPAGRVLDVLQVPAFLCRQTDLLLACARHGRSVNVKKGQFLAPGDMRHVLAKCRDAGNHDVLLTERGASFGYGNLVVDLRSLVIMRGLGAPVCFDATHAVQLPGGAGDSSGGERQFAAPLARAAAAVGIYALFLEIHEDPARAKSDGPNSLDFQMADRLIAEVLAIRRALGRP